MGGWPRPNIGSHNVSLGYSDGLSQGNSNTYIGSQYPDVREVDLQGTKVLVNFDKSGIHPGVKQWPDHSAAGLSLGHTKLRGELHFNEPSLTTPQIEDKPKAGYQLYINKVSTSEHDGHPLDIVVPTIELAKAWVKKSSTGFYRYYKEVVIMDNLSTILTHTG